MKNFIHSIVIILALAATTLAAGGKYHFDTELNAPALVLRPTSISDSAISISTGGANLMSLTAAGAMSLSKLGIGTSSSSSLLAVYAAAGSAAPSASLLSVSSATAQMFNVFADGRVGIRNANPDANSVQISSLTLRVDGNITPSLSVNSAIQLANKTQAQLQASTPTASGQVYFCSDCDNNVWVVVSTGTNLAQFASFIGDIQW